jgi:ATP-dependent helicase/nuclease subunit A
VNWEASNQLLIRASAGTGKTHQLTSRYLRLLFKDVPPSRILATTFTRKAAGEIFTRIVERLVEGAESDAGSARLSQDLGLAEMDREGIRHRLLQFTRQLPSLRISTLDGFFTELSLLLSRHLRLPPRWQLVDGAKTQEILALERLISESTRPDLKRLVQWLAKGESARSVHELLREQVHQLFALYLETEAAGVTPWQFVRQALRWDQPHPQTGLLPENELFPVLDRLVHIANQAATEDTTDKLRTAIETVVQRAKSEDWKGFLTTTIVKNVLSGDGTYHRKKLPDGWIEPIQSLGAHAKAHQLHAVIQHTEGAYELLQRFDQCFVATKTQSRTFLFEDLPRLLARYFVAPKNFTEKTPGMRAWNDALELVDHLLLDEFQDTSLVQWGILRPFVQRIVGLKGEGSLIIVGDSKQSIYEWRGGIPELLGRLEHEFPTLKSVDLSVSRRSCPAVIDAVNRVFSNLDAHDNFDDQHSELVAWARHFPKHSTVRTDLDGCVTLRYSDDDPHADELLSPLEAGVQVVAEILHDAPQQSIAVLMNTNQNVAEMLYQLHAAGIDAGETGGGALTDSAAVRVILSALTWIDHPGHTAAAFHILQSPLAKVFRPRSVTAAAEFTKLPPELATDLRSQLLARGYGDVIAEWASLLEPHCGVREQQRLKQMCQMTYLWRNDWGIRTEAFRRRVREAKVPLATEALVSVMTIHQSKGLQFDSVVLCDLEHSINSIPNFVMSRHEESLEPIAVCRYQAQEIQALLPKSVQDVFRKHANRRMRERLSMLYVAMTRAVHGLHIVVAPPAKGKQSKLRKSFAGLVCAALLHGDRLPLGDAFVLGNPRWSSRTNRNA